MVAQPSTRCNLMGLSSAVFRAAGRHFINTLVKFFTASLGVSIDRHMVTPGLSSHPPTQKSSSAEETLLMQGELYTLFSPGPREEEEAAELPLTVYTERKISTPHLLANNSMPTMPKKP